MNGTVFRDEESPATWPFGSMMPSTVRNVKTLSAHLPPFILGAENPLLAFSNVENLTIQVSISLTSLRWLGHSDDNPGNTSLSFPRLHFLKVVRYAEKPNESERLEWFKEAESVVQKIQTQRKQYECLISEVTLESDGIMHVIDLVSDAAVL
jgi:hypothetical protein